MNPYITATYFKGAMIMTLKNNEDVTPLIQEILDSYHNNTLNANEIRDIVGESVKAVSAQTGLTVIDQLIKADNTLKKALFIPKVSALLQIPDLKNLLKEVQDYEKNFKRDAESLAVLVNTYLIEGYEKHQDELPGLIAQLNKLRG